MVSLPYCMKLLIQELESAGVATRLVTKTNISNVPVLKYLYDNISKNSVTEDIFDDDVDVSLHEIDDDE